LRSTELPLSAWRTSGRPCGPSALIIGAQAARRVRDGDPRRAGSQGAEALVPR
jgi:hypothetical protein